MSTADELLGTADADTKLRVLIVDDHDVVHWGFRLMLGNQTWVERCISSRSAAEAYALAARYKPHVCLLYTSRCV